MKWDIFTLHLVLERFDLGIGVMNELIHLLAQRIVFFRKTLCEMFLVDNLLRCLVAVKGQTAACTLHDDCWAEATQHGSLVVFGWIETRNDHIVWIVK